MGRIIRIGSPSLAWLPRSLHTPPYGVGEDEVAKLVRDFEQELWVANQGLVPDRSGKAWRWGALAWTLRCLTAALVLAWIPAALLARRWVFDLMPPPIEGQEFLIGLVRYVAPVALIALAALSTYAGFVARALRRPFDVAGTAAAGRRRWSGMLVRGVGRVLSRRTLGRMTLLLVLGLIVAVIALNLVPNGPEKAVVENAVATVLVLGFFACLLGWLLLMLLPAPLRSPLDHVVQSIDRVGRQIQQPSADDARIVDRRKPILLLRSFRDDNLKLADRAGQLRFEEVLAEALPRLGPLIAIGRPGQSLPDLGAARNYYSDAEWRDAVTAWMNEALLIVVVAGRSSGLAWELETIARHGHVAKMIVFMPPVDRPERWANLQRALAALSTSAEPVGAMPRGLLCLHGTPDAEVTMVAASSATAPDYRRAIRYALFAMFCRKALEAKPS